MIDYFLKTMLRAVGRTAVVLLMWLPVAAWGPACFAEEAEWRHQLPSEVQDRILWFGDLEEGALSDWSAPNEAMAGGGVFNTGQEDVLAETTTEIVHSGRYSALTRITNAFQSRNGNRAVRLMRWTDKPWNEGGKMFPAAAYYSVWAYFPESYDPRKYGDWDPGDGGWWSIFQFKANDDNGVSQQIFGFGVDSNQAKRSMELTLYSNYNSPHSFSPIKPALIRTRKWVHLEAYYERSVRNQGVVKFWLDGQLVFDISGVRTILTTRHDYAVWGIGNYTDHIEGGRSDGEATIYFDDAAVSTVRLSEHARFSTIPRRGRQSLRPSDAIPRLPTIPFQATPSRQ